MLRPARSNASRHAATPISAITDIAVVDEDGGIIAAAVAVVVLPPVAGAGAATSAAGAAVATPVVAAAVFLGNWTTAQSPITLNDPDAEPLPPFFHLWLVPLLIIWIGALALSRRGQARWLGTDTLILGGVAFKLGAFPFHTWIPDVYQGAPTPTTAFLGTASKAAGAFTLVLLATGPFAPIAVKLAPLLGVTAVLTLLFGNLGALATTDVKRTLSLSGVAHAGFILAAVTAALAWLEPHPLLVFPVLFLEKTANDHARIERQQRIRRHGRRRRLRPDPRVRRPLVLHPRRERQPGVRQRQRS